MATRSTTTVTRQRGRQHPILRGVDAFPAKSWLYHVEPLNGPATLLLDGTQRQLGQEGQGGPVSARAAGGLDA